MLRVLGTSQLVVLAILCALGSGCRSRTVSSPAASSTQQQSPASPSQLPLTDLGALIESRPPTRERLETYLRALPAFEKAAAGLPADALRPMQGKNPMAGFAAVVVSPAAREPLAKAITEAGGEPDDFYATHLIMQAYLIIRQARRRGVSFKDDAAATKAKVNALNEQARKELAAPNVTNETRARWREDLAKGQALLMEAQERARMEQAIGLLTSEQRSLLEEYSSRLKAGSTASGGAPPGHPR